MRKILPVFPDRIKNPLSAALYRAECLYEIHIVSGRAVYICTPEGLMFCGLSGKLHKYYCTDVIVPSFDETEEILDRASSFSGFMHERELSEGYITCIDGCRIGVCTAGGESQGRINSLCIRVPAENENIFFDSSVMSHVMSSAAGVLISGPPASGKTTLLRYIAENLTSGAYLPFRKVCVIDERYEIAGNNCRKLQNGITCDILSGTDKSIAIFRALRVLSPEIIICDEIGSVSETAAILEGLNSGVKFISSVHASDVSQLVRKKQFRLLFSENVFDKFLFLSALSPGKITQVLNYGEVRDEIGRTCGDMYSTEPQRNFIYRQEKEKSGSAL